MLEIKIHFNSSREHWQIGAHRGTATRSYKILLLLIVVTKILAFIFSYLVSELESKSNINDIWKSL